MQVHYDEGVATYIGPEPSGTSTHLTRQLSGTHYDGVRLLVPVHHRLRLQAFPMRTIVLGTHSTPMARPETSQVLVRPFCT